MGNCYRFSWTKLLWFPCICFYFLIWCFPLCTLHVLIKNFHGLFLLFLSIKFLTTHKKSLLIVLKFVVIYKLHELILLFFSDQYMFCEVQKYNCVWQLEFSILSNFFPSDAVSSCGPGIYSICVQYCICLFCAEQNGHCQVCKNLKWGLTFRMSAQHVALLCYLISILLMLFLLQYTCCHCFYCPRKHFSRCLWQPSVTWYVTRFWDICLFN